MSSLSPLSVTIRRMASPSSRWLIRTFLATALLCLALHAHAQTPDSSDGPLQPSTDVSRVHLLGNDDILRMAKAGLGDDLLVQTIQLQPGHYSTSPDDLISLKAGGISDRVIAAMEAHGSGLSVRSASDPLKPQNSVAPTPLAAGIDEIGVYYKDKDGQYVPLHIERVIFKSGGAVKSILTHNIIQKDLNGHIDGAKSTLVLQKNTPIVIYAPTGTAPEEYIFLQFREHGDYREFRVKTGGVFHSETGAERDSIDFTATKLASQMYTFNLPADLPKGEYGMLPPGAASNTQGIAGTGKIFTFSIPE